jgi:tetratricopeptide (TPR) repeat protein
VNRFTAEAYDQAEILLKQALELDPGFAPAWVELGRVHLTQAMAFGLRPYDEASELARHAIQQALAIDPQNGGAYAALAGIEMNYDWDFVMASQHLQQALKLNPGDAGILRTAARLEQILGRNDDAIDLYRQSIVLDPLSGHFGLGVSLYRAHRLEEAADSLRMELSLTPGGAVTQHRLGLVLLAQGDAPAALAEINQEPDDGWRLAGLAIVQHALGDAGASDAALEELIERFSADMAYQVADAYAFRGEIDNAFEWLERAYESRDSGLTSLLLDPLLTNLHDDPRWEPLLDKMGLPH